MEGMAPRALAPFTGVKKIYETVNFLLSKVNQSVMTQTLKSKKLSFYDADGKKLTRVFNAVEQEAANRAFNIVTQVSLRNEIKVNESWASISRCDCEEHDLVFYLFILNIDVLPIEVVHDVERGLEKTDSELAYIVPEGKKIRLVVGQNVPET
jgi:hypothetical protein